MMNSISIYIRAKNEAKGLERTLAGIREQSRQPDEIVVLDNVSTDATAQVAKEFGAIVHEISDGQFTYGRALNMALQLTRGDVIVFLSAHSPPVDQEWLKELLAPLETDPPAAATFGRQIPEPGVNPMEEWLTYRAFPRHPHWLLSRLQLQNITFSNANAALTREVLDRFEFREDLSFAEDIEWWERVQQAGCRVRYCPKSVVYHSHQPELDSLERRMFHVGESMKQCGSGQAFMNPVTCVIIFSGTIVIDFVYCLLKGHWREISKILNYRRHFFRGLRRGISGIPRADGNASGMP